MQLKPGDQLFKLNWILVMQKMATRLITFNDAHPTAYGPSISSDPIFAKLETLKISDVYKYYRNSSEIHFQMYQQNNTDKLVYYASRKTWLSHKVKHQHY